jgi:hypothetical protein
MARFCQFCGTQMLAEAGFCPSCGKNAGASPTSSTGGSAAAQAVQAREERRIFENGEIRVTNARLIVSGQTYAMSGITSVKAVEVHPSKQGPLLLIGVGILCVIVASSNRSAAAGVIGAVLAVLGVMWLLGLKPSYTVQLTSASGETRALTSNDRSLIASVVDAINEAIVHRG